MRLGKRRKVSGDEADLGDGDPGTAAPPHPPLAEARCRTKAPALRSHGNGRKAACLGEAAEESGWIGSAVKQDPEGSAFPQGFFRFTR